MITVKKNQIVSLTVDVIFFEKQSLLKNFEIFYDPQWSNCNSICFNFDSIYILDIPMLHTDMDHRAGAILCKNVKYPIEGKLISAAVFEGLQNSDNSEFCKIRILKRFYRVLNGMMNRRMIFRLSTRSSTTADEQIAQI